MHKVLVEEGRRGGGNWKGFRRRFGPEEDPPSKQGMRQPYSARKGFGEHLGPLKRWLRSNVGRRWNDVYAEASSIVKPDSVVRAHIRFHLLQMVERNTFMRCGAVWHYGRGGQPQKANLQARYSPWPHFYVHPETGALLEGGPSWGSGRGRGRVKPQPLCDPRWFGNSHAFATINGIWYECEFVPMVQRRNKDEALAFDLGVGRRITETEAVEYYGVRRVMVRKRQLSSKELRRNGLANDVGKFGVDSAARSARVSWGAILAGLVGTVERRGGMNLFWNERNFFGKARSN